MIYGIPNFKLEKEVVLRRHALAEAAGISFELNCAVGQDVSFAELRARHDAVLIATGVYKAREIGGPGAGLGGIVPALDYLIASNRKNLGDARAGFRLRPAERGGQAGGGDRRRRHRDGLRAHGGAPGRDIGAVPVPARPGQHAGLDARGEERRGRRRGVRLAVGARSLPGRRRGRAACARCACISACRTATGRQSVEPIAGSHFTVGGRSGHQGAGLRSRGPAGDVRRTGAGGDALGHAADQPPQLHDQSLPGVFAAGDIVRGASLVVWAIRDGRDAAKRIHEYVMQQQALPAAAESQ